MTSKYAIALYEMICLRSNLDNCLEPSTCIGSENLWACLQVRMSAWTISCGTLFSPQRLRSTDYPIPGCGSTWCGTPPGLRSMRSRCPGGESHRRSSRLRIVPSGRQRNQSLLAHPGVLGRVLDGKINRDLQLVFGRGTESLKGGPMGATQGCR